MADKLIIEPAGNEDYLEEELRNGFNETMESGNSEEHAEPYIAFIEPLNNVTRKTGDNIRLKCQVEGTLPISFKWYKNDALVLKEKGRVNVNVQENLSRLKINNLNTLDTGYYKCEASNKWGKIESTALLKVAVGSANKPRPNISGGGGGNSDGFVSSYDRSLAASSHSNQVAAAGTCQFYDGQACSKYLSGQRIFVKADDPYEMMRNDRILLGAIRDIHNSSQVSEPCKKYAEKAFCYHNFEMCDNQSSVANSAASLDVAVIRICRNDCSVMEKDICPEEYTTARQHSMVGRGNLLPDCSELPESTPRCTRLLGDFNELPRDDHHCYSDNGVTYRGKADLTESGRRCLKWIDVRKKYPQYKSSTYLELTDNNFCRNPGGEKPKPWCIVADGSEEYCNLPRCPPPAPPPGIATANGGGVGNADQSTLSTAFTDSSNHVANVLGIPSHYGAYVLLAASGLGVFVLALLLTLVCRTVCGRKKKRQSKHQKKTSQHNNVSNGFLTNGSIRKPLASDQQVELMNLIGGSSSVSSSGAGVSATSCAGNGNGNCSQRSQMAMVVNDPVQSTAALQRIPIGQLRFVEKLGEGQYGKVWKGELASATLNEDCMGGEPTQVALKTLKENASIQQKVDFEREAMMLSHLRHPNIVQLLGICISEQVEAMVFEYMMHGDLHEFLLLRSPYNNQFESLDNERILLDHGDFHHIATQIAAGMQYLASMHYVHRDLAARNCLVTDRLVIKICDLGLTRDVYACDYYVVQSTKYLPVRWMPPEAIVYGCFAEASDVWAFGVTLWEMYSYGSRPYHDLDNSQVLDLVRQRCLLECPEHCPPRMYSLMVECWHEMAARRPSFAELHARLQTWPVVASPAHSIVGPLTYSSPYQMHHQQQQHIMAGRAASVVSGSSGSGVNVANHLMTSNGNHTSSQGQLSIGNSNNGRQSFSRQNGPQQAGVYLTGSSNAIGLNATTAAALTSSPNLTAGRKRNGSLGYAQRASNVQVAGPPSNHVGAQTFSYLQATSNGHKNDCNGVDSSSSMS